MDKNTMNDYLEDVIAERDELLYQLRKTSEDECPPHGIPRPTLAGDVPLIFWDVHIYRQSPGYIRVTTFMSSDRTKTDHIVETGPTLAGPWKELRRQL